MARRGVVAAERGESEAGAAKNLNARQWQANQPVRVDAISFDRPRHGDDGMYYTAVFGVVAALGYGAYSLYCHVAKDFEDQQRREEERRRREKAALKAQQAEAGKRLREIILADKVIIDSNIWMNEDHDLFFKFLADSFSTANRVVEVYGAQFDEICNIKHRGSYRDPRGKRARLAINRIEGLQTRKLLRIAPVTLESRAGAHADPVILNLLAATNRQPCSLSLVTDDKELRVRAREVARDGQANVRIIGMREMEADLGKWAGAGLAGAG